MSLTDWRNGSFAILLALGVLSWSATSRPDRKRQHRQKILPIHASPTIGDDAVETAEHTRGQSVGIVLRRSEGHEAVIATLSDYYDALSEDRGLSRRRSPLAPAKQDGPVLANRPVSS
jgi:hypothetical protein